MVCRETPLGSALTSYVKILHGVEEYQSLSMYHELIRESPHGLDNTPAFDRIEFVREMSEKVELSDSFTPARKRSLLERLDRAAETEMAANLFYASKRIEERSARAKVALDDFYGNTARSLGVSVSQVRDRLAASYEESKRERTLVAPEEWIQEFTSRPGHRSLPMDRHTAYGMWRLDTEIAAMTVAAEATPAITNHRRLTGTAVSAAGYDPHSGRLEVEMRSRPGRYYAYQNVPAEVAERLLTAQRPTSVFNQSIRNVPDYQYATAEAAEAAGVRRRCRSCGQFAANDHGCPPQGSDEEAFNMAARSRIQQEVARARAEMNSGNFQTRVARMMEAHPELSRSEALRQMQANNRLASASPETTLRARTGLRLAARIYPYRGESGMFRCTALSSVRRILTTENETHVPVTARITHTSDENGRPVPVNPGIVSGRVTIANNHDADGPAYVARPFEMTALNPTTDRLQCTCAEYQRNYDCPHVRQLVSDMGRRVNQPYLSTPHRISDIVAEVQAEATAEHDASVTAQEAARAARDTAATVSYTDNMAAFQADYRAAKARIAAGEDPIPYMRDNATGGLGARDGGRAFGVEIEFELPDDITDWERSDTLAAIGQDLYDAGLTSHAQQTEYHTSQEDGYTENHNGGWSFEDDCSVAGEIVSPIMYDEPQTWENLEKVCDIVRRHGGIATVATGAHVHVGTSDYDHTVENHTRLIQMVNEHEDTLYRLASNPTRGTHRNTDYARPNPVAPATGYRSIGDAARTNRGYTAINMANNLYGEHDDHTEYRVWDGTLSPAVIQAQVKMSLAITQAAFRDTDYTPSPAEHVGTHRLANTAARAEDGAPRRLTGEAWETDTAGYRAFADRMFARPEDKAQLTALFAATKWQRPARRRG